MSGARFDSSQLLPLFQILSSKSSTNVNNMDEPKEVTHRRKSKTAGVPVHNPQTSARPDRKSIIKVNKNKYKNERATQQNEEYAVIENAAESNIVGKPRISRKDLEKEKDKMRIENEKIVKKLVVMDNSLSSKDMECSRLKEKYEQLREVIIRIKRENEFVNAKYQNLLIDNEKILNELDQKCTNCISIKKSLNKTNSELSVVKDANKNLSKDLDMLKNVIYRLNVQLERYQQKLHSHVTNNTINSETSPPPTDIEVHTEIQNDSPTTQDNTNDITLHNDHQHTPVSWGSVNAHTLGPLLDAYQETLNEKEEIINNYELELAKFTNKFKMILDENELLHKKIVEEKDSMEKCSMEMINNRKELKTMKEQNDLLIKKCAVKQDKLQDICKVYDHKIESLQRDRDILQEEYHKTKANLFDLQEKYDTLSKDHNTLLSDKQSVIPLEVHNIGVNECKRLFEELKVKYDLEKSKLTSQVKHFEEQFDEMNKKLIELKAEKQELQIKVKTTEKQLKKSEQKLSEIQKSLTHTKISRDSCKRQLTKAIEFGKELVNEQESLMQQLTYKQKENKAVKQIGSSIVNRMDVLKTQLKTVQKDAYHQLASVEQRIQEQDSSIESMRRSHESEIEKLVRELKDKDEYIAKLIEQNSTIPGTQYLLYREKHMHLS